MTSLLDANSISASSGASEKLNLSMLQSKLKSDPEGYTSELDLIYNQFKTSLDLFQQQADLNFTSISGISTDTAVAKDLGDRAMFLAHVTPFYPKELAKFPYELVQFLSSARNLLSGLRRNVTQALILLSNRKIIDIVDTLVIFMELQTVGDKTLKTLVFSHVIQSIRRMNQKHKNDPKNRALQSILIGMLKEEATAKQALITLCVLYRKKVWFDDRTANAICAACLHESPRIMVAALSFLLDYEKIEGDEDTDDSASEDESATKKSHVVLSKEAIYKANNKGTSSSKKKKKAKLQRVVRSMKKQQRRLSNETNSNYCSPLNHLKDPQGFTERLFSLLQSSKDRFERKMMMLKVVARTIGLHQLVLLNFYRHLQKYVQPHQQDVTNILAAAVQACHEMVPPEAVEPLFKQIVNQFVHDKSRPEAMTVGLNVVREICLRMPLLMTEDLLQDLVLYRKSNEKSVSSSARSLLTLFREVCPALLVKKDRGRPTNPNARPKAFGEVHVASNIPGVELLNQEDDGTVSSDEDVDDERSVASTNTERQDEDDDDDVVDGLVEEDSSDSENLEDDESEGEDNIINCDDASELSDEEEESEGESDEEKIDLVENDISKGKKRKLSDFEGQLNAASKSLRALKRLAGTTGNASSNTEDDGFLSNEDFQKIRELQAKNEARTTLSQFGFKLPSSDELSSKRVDGAKLEANIRQKLTKDERLAMIREGREESGKYQSRTSVKKKKTGGSSNREKEHKKAMPIVAKRSKIARNRLVKKKLRRRADTQFRGKKAWK